MQEHGRSRNAAQILARVFTLTGIFTAAACTHQAAENGSSENVSIPNPAAVFCVDQGGEYLLDSGECRLPDGSVVDAWEYYRENVEKAE